MRVCCFKSQLRCMNESITGVIQMDATLVLKRLLNTDLNGVNGFLMDLDIYTGQPGVAVAILRDGTVVNVRVDTHGRVSYETYVYSPLLKLFMGTVTHVVDSWATL